MTIAPAVSIYFAHCASLVVEDLFSLYTPDDTDTKGRNLLSLYLMLTPKERLSLDLLDKFIEKKYLYQPEFEWEEHKNLFTDFLFQKDKSFVFDYFERIIYPKVSQEYPNLAAWALVAGKEKGLDMFHTYHQSNNMYHYGTQSFLEKLLVRQYEQVFQNKADFEHYLLRLQSFIDTLLIHPEFQPIFKNMHTILTSEFQAKFLNNFKIKPKDQLPFLEAQAQNRYQKKTLDQFFYHIRSTLERNFLDNGIKKPIVLAPLELKNNSFKYKI